jgi:uncharacterized protein YoxC
MAMSQRRRNEDSFCRHVSMASCIVVIIIVLGVIPYTYVLKDIENKKSLEEISNSLKSLEREHNEIVTMLNNLETDLERGQVPVNRFPPKIVQASGSLTTVGAAVSQALPGILTPVKLSSSSNDAQNNHPVNSEPLRTLPPPGSSSSGPITFGTPSLASSTSVLVVGGTGAYINCSS